MKINKIRKINVILFDKAQEIVKEYQTKNQFSNLDDTINNLIEEFAKLKKEKK